ncbi:hypothetical protein [Pseudomonas sp. GM30]|uniref:hypothetical protein n=1 Tax=Pseudomonas sp. GM30 TaxID=1144328 RepID=UPI0002704583|nr:hypothetical protein [Pseudomonas sp. GM30]EUB84138.1 hypothetical protein PMI25_002071 [Pseudomonas sp. GM30]
MGYNEEWKAAVERSERYGLAVPMQADVTQQRYLTKEVYDRFPYVVSDAFGDLGYEDVVAQCMSIHYRLLPVIEDLLECPVFFTIGWVDDGSEKGMFRFDEDFIQDRLQKPSVALGGETNLHAWLTLPSMEVIDVSLVTTIAVVQKLEKGHGGVLAGPADDFKGFAYKPMLVGIDFLKRAGMLFEL